MLARGFAEATGATVVSPGSDDRPQCRWSESTVEGKGLLVRFGPVESLEDTVRLRVYSMCRASWSFRQGHEFVFRWRRGAGWEFVAAPLVFIT